MQLVTKSLETIMFLTKYVDVVNTSSMWTEWYIDVLGTYYYTEFITI